MSLGLLLFFRAFTYFAKFYFLLLVIRILLYWFPNIPIYRQPWSGLISITDPYLTLFRPVAPVIYGYDLSSLVAFFVIQTIIELGPRLTLFFST